MAATRAKRTQDRATRPARVAVYVRLSKERAGSVSIVKQREACEDRVKQLGAEYFYDARMYDKQGDYYVDNDRSAFQADAIRPAFDELIRRIKENEYRRGVVVFYALDRLVRRTKQWVEVEELARNHGVGLLAVTQPIDTTNEHSSIVATLLAELAQHEAKTIGRRVQSAQTQLAKEGRYFGGRIPFGYARVVHPDGVGYALAPHPTESEVIRRAAELVLDRTPLTVVARRLNAEGFRNRSGGPLRGSNLGKWLRNPALKGTPTYGGRQVGAARGERSWLVEAVLDDKQWRALQLVLDRNPALSAGRQRDNDILLAGLVRCATCGHRMRGVVRAYGTYGCFAGSDGSGECASPSYISRDALDEFVIEWFLSQLRRNAAGSDEVKRKRAVAAGKRRLRLLGEQHSQIDAAVRRIEAREDAGEFDGKPAIQRRNTVRLEELYQELERLELEIDEIDLRLRRLRSRESEAITRADWDALDIFTRRRLLADFIECVVVARPPLGNRSGPKAVLTQGRVVIRSAVETLAAEGK